MLHEFTHKLLYETYHGLLPVRYEEGLAEFFDTARPEHGQLAIGMAPADRWLDFKAARWMPLRKVFEVGRDSPEYRGHGEHGREGE